jgi:formylglycine-generating enzyme required for sulfatase activity
MPIKSFKQLLNWKIGGIVLGVCALVWLGLSKVSADSLFDIPKLVARNIAYFDSLDLGKAKPAVTTKQQIASKDGMVLIYVPAGKFIMGTNIKNVIQSNPKRQVYVSAFWIDRTEVSNAMYARCVKDGKCDPPINPRGKNHYYDSHFANYPVVYVRWSDAVAYCLWADRRLPSEAEWEKAARGTDGRAYPWGNNDPNPSLLNYNNNIGGLMPVDSYPSGAGPYGVLNMAGNVREWVNDWYDVHYYLQMAINNPVGPSGGKERTLRGGAFDDTVRQITTYNRFSHWPWSAGNDRGFRCAMSGD